MITRIGIDGFKSFLDFELDAPPFLVLVGPNSAGKSNLLDAIEFWWSIRGSSSSSAVSDALLKPRRGRPHELFHQGDKGLSVETFRIRVDSLVYGTEQPARLNSLSETLTADMLNTGTFRVGRPTAVESWVETGVRPYVPNPQAMRGLASAADTRALVSDGSNLAAALGRMRDTEAFDELLVDLTALIPDVMKVVPELNEKRQEWSFDLVIDRQGSVPSTLLSDGTLRVLGLLAALHDPDHAGVLMVEEIENGLHPSRLAELLRRIQRQVTDLSDAESMDRPLRQVILTSHSPVVVSELYRTRPESLVFMDSVLRIDPDHDRVSRVSVAKPVRDDGEPGMYVSPRQVRKYLSTAQWDEP